MSLAFGKCQSNMLPINLCARVDIVLKLGCISEFLAWLYKNRVLGPHLILENLYDKHKESIFFRSLKRILGPPICRLHL